MNHTTFKSVRSLCLASLTALCLVAQAQTAPSTMPQTGSSQGQMPRTMPAAQDMKSSMMTGMDMMQKMPMSGDTDKDFATMMKIHHQQAVEMAQMELANGRSPEMKKMAKQIIAAQNKEIAQFNRWLAKQK